MVSRGVSGGEWVMTITRIGYQVRIHRNFTLCLSGMTVETWSLARAHRHTRPRAPHIILNIHLSLDITFVTLFTHHRSHLQQNSATARARQRQLIHV